MKVLPPLPKAPPNICFTCQRYRPYHGPPKFSKVKMRMGDRAPRLMGHCEPLPNRNGDVFLTPIYDSVSTQGCTNFKPVPAHVLAWYRAE